MTKSDSSSLPKTTLSISPLLNWEQTLPPADLLEWLCPRDSALERLLRTSPFRS